MNIDNSSTKAETPSVVTTPNSDIRLGQARAEIGRLDRQIVELLNRRASAALEVGAIKRELGAAVYDAVQETRVYDRIREENQKTGAVLTDQAVVDIYREIVSASRALQEPLTVAALGPEASMSHLAIRAQFGAEATPVFEPTIQAVFDAVAREEAKVGIVPVENSLEGSVGATMDALMASQLDVLGELYLPITYDLLSQAGSLEDIKVVYSHPQALAQCADWLNRHIPRATVEPVESTARAAQLAAADPTAAAVASQIAGETYGVPVLAEHTEDAAHNMTRFLVIGRGSCEQTGNDKTSLIMSTAHAPGALYSALSIFADHSISLSRLESRPLESRPWEYMFFIDFEGHRDDLGVAACLAELAERVSFHRVLGSYPQGDRPW